MLARRRALQSAQADPWSVLRVANAQANPLLNALDRSKARVERAKEHEDVVFEVDSARDLRAISKNRQADASMHTQKMWEVRLALRREPSMRAVLQTWWLAMLRTIQHAFPPGEVPHVDEETYVHIFVIISHCIAAHEGEPFDEAEAWESAREDWASDCSPGSDAMSREQFQDALFALADVYVDSVAPDEYARFLRLLLHDCIGDADGVFWVGRGMDHCQLFYYDY